MRLFSSFGFHFIPNSCKTFLAACMSIVLIFRISFIYFSKFLHNKTIFIYKR
ncbi:hypothetical protein DsansV1_C20g0164521 [Dioscorea sansibarensis]